MSEPSLDALLSQKYPSKQHAKNVSHHLHSQRPTLTGGLIYLESPKLIHHEDSDAEAPFRQRRSFYYLSGCPLPSCHLTYDISSDKLTLYIPPLDPESVMWSGLPLSKHQALTTFDVDEVKNSGPELKQDLESYAARATPAEPIFIIDGQAEFLEKCWNKAGGSAGRDGGNIPLLFPQQVEGSLDAHLLKQSIDELRVIKDDYEIALIKKANLISTEAHHAVLRSLIKHNLKTEASASAVFLKECVARGADEQAYKGIFASGRSAATLHYTANKAPLEGKLNLLVDAGAEWNCYASDITRTFPINGKFSKESLEIYELVLEMQRKCIAYTQAGVQWEKVHELAHKVAIEGLLRLGIFRKDVGTLEDILEARTSCAFFPHGLGHWLGMDVHDSGGHPDYEDKDPMFRYLRVRRKLVKGAVVTVEPGIYFCEFILRPYLQDGRHKRFIDEEVLERYWDVGGVRIEDNVLVLDHGNENLTTVVKEVDDVLRMINGE